MKRYRRIFSERKEELIWKKAPNNLISSQLFLDDDIVEEKRREKDYEIIVSPVKEGDEEYLILTDGHHSLKASLLDNKKPILLYDKSAQKHVNEMGLEEYLDSEMIDTSWYYVKTGKEVGY